MDSKKLCALELIDQGFYLIPLHSPSKEGECSCGKSCGSEGKHPRISDWRNKASRESHQVKEWWNKWPDANIGIVCGKESDLVVLDVDPRHGGESSLDKLEEDIGGFTLTTTVATGGGGNHFYYRHPGEGHIINSSGALGQGLDIKTDGGYIVAPGSTHKSGLTYEWQIPIEEIRRFPDEVIKRLGKKTSTALKQPEAHSLSSIEPIHEGSRNDTLFILGAKLRNSGMTHQQIINELIDINSQRCIPPLEESEVKQIAKSASTLPANQYDEEYGLWDTDFGNTRKFVEQYEEVIKFDIDEGHWLIWDGVRWKIDPSMLRVMGLAKDLIENIFEEGLKESNEERGKLIQRHAKKSANEAKMKSMINLATTFPSIHVAKYMLDQNALLVTLDNLTIDLKSQKKLKHSPDHYITKKLDFSFDSKAQCPIWESFITQIMGGDEEMIAFIQQTVGYSLSGLSTEQCLFFLYGNGRNGKSTFVEVLLILFGEYSIKAASEMVMNRKYGAGIPNDIARLCGHRLVILSEIQEGKRLDEAKVKNLTGGDTIQARFLRKEFFEFNPSHKLWVFGNHKPLINGTDDGIWRRLRLIKFGVTIPKEQVDPELKEKLLKELPGIFNWAVKGCRRWIENGQRLNIPESVIRDTLAYRGEMDLLSAFLNEACHIGTTESCSNQALRQTYEDWCSQNGVYPMSGRAMNPKLEQKGFVKFKSDGRVHWRGLSPNK